ncbi:MAG: alpha/beta hydrolase [Chlorobia bacterium]|nr:alpha/beta hydrolase [Fimbriimonadaceae bacterium]
MTMPLSAILLLMLAPQAKRDASPHLSGFVSSNGVRLHYLDWGGKGPTLLFISGTGDDAHAFDDFAPRFKDRFRVLALTRRGYGRSDKPTSGYDIPNLAEDVRGFLDAMKISRVSLVGHSAGGDELSRFAVSYPNWVDKLVYLDAGYDRSDIAILAKDDPIPDPGPSSKYQELHWKGMDNFRPEFSRIKAPALSFYAIFERHWGVDSKTPKSLAKRAKGYLERVIQPWQRRNIERFRREVRNGRVVEYRGTHHYFFDDPKMVDRVVAEMREFLAK